MKQNKIILIALVVILSATSCSKYPDGPMFSLRTKTERVTNNWKVAQALDNGVDETADYTKYELDLAKDGGATLAAKYVTFGVTYEFVTVGTWSFVDDKNKISFVLDNDDANGVYQILKLQEDEMWLKKDQGTIELHYVTR